MKNYVLSETAVAKLKHAITPRLGDSSAPNSSPAAVSTDMFPAPFTVRWAFSTAEGAVIGDWLIYIPSTNAVSLNGAVVSNYYTLPAAGGLYPAGWYKLRISNSTGSYISRTESDALYMNVYVPLDTTQPAYYRLNNHVETGDSSRFIIIPILICSTVIDSTTGARRVKQYVSSSIVLTDPRKGTTTTADEKSISRAYYTQGDGVQIQNFSDIVQIKGFGRFHPDATLYPTQIRGTYDAASSLEITDEDSAVAALVRIGNVDDPDANTLGFRTLKVGTTPPSPFQFVTTLNGQSARAIINNNFYFAGTLRTLSDFTGAPETGTVYLTAIRTAPDYQRREPPVWSFALATTPATADTGQLAMNIKLYEFANGKVTMDYRHTFLTVPAPDFDLYYSMMDFVDLKLGSGQDAVTLGKIVGSQAASIAQKTIAAGTGITVTEAGGVITIAATGSSTSGYTGTRTVLADCDYDDDACTLRRRYITEVWSNGVMVSQTLGAWEVYTQAVEETV